MSIRSNEENGKVIIRFIAFTHVPVEGAYAYEDILKICSLPDDAPKPEYLMGAPNPLLIEYAFPKITEDELTKIPEINEYSREFDLRIILSKYSFSKQDEILSVLSVITKYVFDKDQGSKRWVLCDSDRRGLSNSEEKGVGYYWDGLIEYEKQLNEHAFDEFPMIDGNTYYSSVVAMGEPFMLCDQTTEHLNKYFSLDNDQKEAFLSACVLFTQASRTWQVSHSLAYLGFISSVEALIDYDYRGVSRNTCNSCGQPQFKVRQKFLDFAAKYGNKEDSFRRYVDKLYNRRSAIGHQGKLLSRDVAGNIMVPHIEMNESRDLMHLQTTVRLLLVNWLILV